MMNDERFYFCLQSLCTKKNVNKADNKHFSGKFGFHALRADINAERVDSNAEQEDSNAERVDINAEREDVNAERADIHAEQEDIHALRVDINAERVARCARLSASIVLHQYCLNFSTFGAMPS